MSRPSNKRGSTQVGSAPLTTVVMSRLFQLSPTIVPRLRSPFPWRYRLHVGPEPLATALRLLLNLVETHVRDIPVEYPRHSTPDLLCIGIDAIAAHSPKGPSKAIYTHRVDNGVTLKAEFRERLSRLRAEGLLLLRRINFGQANLELSMVRRKDRKRVAISDSDYAAS